MVIPRRRSTESPAIHLSSVDNREGFIINTHYLTICSLILFALEGCSKSPATDVVAVKPSFGYRQVQQMLDDRPDMQNVIPTTDPVMAWIIDGFDGKRFGHRIHWNADSPQGGHVAVHAPPYENYPPHISVSGGTETTPIDKWASVVYELHNIQNNDEFEKLHTQAIEGKLDADQYATKCVELEFDALIKTRSFLRVHPLPASPHGRDTFYKWIKYDLGTFQEYERAFSIAGSNSRLGNFAYFKQQFEKSLAPHAEAARKAKP